VSCVQCESVERSRKTEKQKKLEAKIALLRVIPTMTFIPSGILSGISSGILSDILSGVLSGISSGILSGR